MSKLFPHLFTPGKIGSLTLKNRIMKAPQSSGMSNMDGTVSLPPGAFGGRVPGRRRRRHDHCRIRLCG